MKTRSRFLLVGLLATLAGVGLGVGWWLFYRPQVAVTVPAAPPPPAPPPVKGPDAATLAALDAATEQARRANAEAARKIAQLEERMRGDLCPKPPPPPPPPTPPPPPPPRPPESRMQMPEKPGDLASLKGCWRTDPFRHEPHRAPGVSRYCFDENGRGTLEFARQGGERCRAPARIRFAGSNRLTIDDSGGRCGADGPWYPDVLQCQGDAQRVVRCTGASDTPQGRTTWSVNLHRD